MLLALNLTRNNQIQEFRYFKNTLYTAMPTDTDDPVSQKVSVWFFFV